MKKLLNGNEALAYGALAAGIGVFAGYPITPSTDVYEILEKELEKVGGKFLYAESERAAINMVMGAYISGKRAMTCTSGCGFSLMQEGISYIAADFCPAVIVNVTREGAGLGDIPRSQGDYWQMTKNGGNGDYHTIVIACSSISECMKAPEIAFSLAEKYRNPVIITYDSDIAHTRESVEIPDFTNKIKKLTYDWVLDGHKNGEHKVVQNIYYHNKNYDNILKEKYELIEKNTQRWKEYNVEKAKVILVAYGICGRICKDVVDIYISKGIDKVGLIMVETLYPFPKDAFKKIKNAKCILTVELNVLKQMVDDVKIATSCKIKVDSIGKMSICPTVKEIVEKIDKMEV